MIQQHIFVCGSSLLSHPVSNLFHLGADAGDGIPGSDDLEGKRLVIVDCRVSAAADLYECLQAVPKEMPVLMLSPSLEHFRALEGRYGVIPDEPQLALLARAYENSAGLDNCVINALPYPALSAGKGGEADLSRLAEEQGAPEGLHEPEEECACTDFEALSRALVEPQLANDFYSKVEASMQETLTEADTNPPTGVKYYNHTYTSSYSFTYSNHKTNKSAGSADFTWIVWAFLSESASQNQQYMSVHGNLSLSAGQLYSNDSCDRGYGNMYFQGTLDCALSKYDFSPTTGSGSFSGSVDIAISYKPPTGGYQIWNYDDSISYSVDSWSAKSISSGSALGAQWYMNSPFDGSNIDDKWKDGFTTWGHVKDFPGATTGTAEVSSISTWYTNTLQTGYVSVTGNFGWEGGRLHGSSCSPGMYWKINADWTWYSNRNPGFSVDFSGLQPS